MNLPVEISPNPLVISTVELRININVSPNEIIPHFISLFAQEFPKFETTNILPEMRNHNPGLKYAADYTMSNDSFRISFSKNSVAFENVGEYKFWANYFGFITKCVEKLYSLKIILQTERIGVRYASVLGSTLGLEQIFKTIPTMSLGLEEKMEIYRTVISTGDIKMALHIAPNAKATAAATNIIKEGVYIDIDAFIESPQNDYKDILSRIEELHIEEKRLFFGLLKDDFIKTLNPKY